MPAVIVTRTVCVPAASRGKLTRSFPEEEIVALTDEEKITYEIKDGEHAYRVRSPDGFILMTVERGSCQVTTGEGDSARALENFRTRLKAAGGDEKLREHGPADYNNLLGTLPVGGGDFVALTFTGRHSGDFGFYASAFEAHKD